MKVYIVEGPREAIGVYTTREKAEMVAERATRLANIASMGDGSTVYHVHEYGVQE